MYFVRENTLPSPFLFRWKRGLPSQLFSQINMCLIIFFSRDNYPIVYFPRFNPDTFFLLPDPSICLIMPEIFHLFVRIMAWARKSSLKYILIYTYFRKHEKTWITNNIFFSFFFGQKAVGQNISSDKIFVGQNFRHQAEITSSSSSLLVIYHA